jgi:hypothetical protein
MRAWAVVIAVVALGGLAIDGFASAALAQTSNTTNCMMTCNSQAATCQATCLVPAAATTTTTTTTSALTATPNATINTTCSINCATAQVNCHNLCARNSPSP